MNTSGRYHRARDALHTYYERNECDDPTENDRFHVQTDGSGRREADESDRPDTVLHRMKEAQAENVDRCEYCDEAFVTYRGDYGVGYVTGIGCPNCFGSEEDDDDHT